MTQNEIQDLRSKTNRGIKAIYNVAHIVDRTPYPWEVEYYSPERGRRAVYNQSNNTVRILWNAIKELAGDYDIGQDEYMWRFCRQYLNKLRSSPIAYIFDAIFSQAYVVGLHNIWAHIAPEDRPRAYQAAQDIMLDIVRQLRSMGGGR